MPGLESGKLSRSGQKMLHQGFPEESIILLEKARLANPDDPRLDIQCSRSLNRVGRIQDAGMLLEESMNRHPGHPVLPLFYGINLYDMGRFKEAVSAFALCLERNPGNILAENYRALALYASGNKKPALDFFQQKRPDNNVEFLARFCSLFENEIYQNMQEDCPEELIDCVEKIFSHNESGPSSSLGYFRRKSLFRKGVKSYDDNNYRRAFYYFKTICEREPDNGNAAFGMTVSLFELGCWDSARNILLYILSGKPSEPNPVAASWLGRVYIYIGEIEKGMKILQSIPLEGPDDFNIHYFMATGYLFKGENEKARMLFEQAFVYYAADTIEDCLNPLLERIRVMEQITQGL